MVLSAEIYALSEKNNEQSLPMAKGQGTFNLYLPDSKEFKDLYPPN